MQVFKNYFRILRRNIKSLILYFGIFLGLTFVFAGAGGGTGQIKSFETTNVNIAVFDEEQSIASKGLITYLETQCQLVDIKDNDLAIQDAMFYEDIDYVVRIKKGYEEQIKTGDVTTLECTKTPKSYTGNFVDTKINAYVGTLSTYLKNGKELSQALASTMDNIKVQTKVSVDTDNELGESTPAYLFYYKYLAYLFIIIFTLGMGLILIQFNQTEIKRRSLCSPLSQFSYNGQLLLASGIFAIVTWALMNGLAILCYHNQEMFFENLPYNMTNSLATAIVSLALGFFAGSIVKTNNAANGIANTLSLAFAFLGGIFVPQAYMNSMILKAAQFVPTYWYVKGMIMMEEGGIKTTSQQHDFFIYLGIQLLFAIALFVLAMVVKKLKQKEN